MWGRAGFYWFIWLWGEFLFNFHCRRSLWASVVQVLLTQQHVGKPGEGPVPVAVWTGLVLQSQTWNKPRSITVISASQTEAECGSLPEAKDRHRAQTAAAEQVTSSSVCPYDIRDPVGAAASMHVAKDTFIRWKSRVYPQDFGPQVCDLMTDLPTSIGLSLIWE